MAGNYYQRSVSGNARPKKAPRTAKLRSLVAEARGVYSAMTRGSGARAGLAREIRGTRAQYRAAGHRVVGSRVYRRDSQGRFA